MGDPDSITKAIKEMNWEQAEQDDFMKALSQSLLIQTPLQVLLEMMFKRVTAQTKAVEEFKEKLGIIEQKSLDTSAFLERVQALEAHVRELSSSKLSPFTQAEILERLDKAELAVDRMRKNVHDVVEDNDQSQGPRIARMERQLLGVNNLPGKLMAVDEMADELGIEVPNMEYEWSEENFSPEDRGTQKTGKLQRKLDKISHENQAMHRYIEELKGEMNNLKHGLDTVQKNSETRLSGMEEHNKETRRKVAHDLQALKRDVAPAEGTSYSDFVKVASEIEKLQSDAQLRTEQIDDIKFKDISGLQETVSSLEKQAQVVAEVHDREQTTARTVIKMEKDVEVLKKRVQNAISAALAGGDGGSLAGVARQSDLQEVAEALKSKPSMEEVRKFVTRALDSGGPVQGTGDMNYAGRALKFRCLSCDRDVVTQRPQPLGQLPSRQGLIPKFEPIAGRESATPIGPGLNAAELRRLQELATERMESQNAHLFLDDRPSTANPPSFLRPSADQDMERPMTSPHSSTIRSFPGPFHARTSTKSKTLTNEKGPKPPVFVT